MHTRNVQGTPASVAELVRLIQTGDDGARQFIRGMEKQVEARFGADMFTPAGLLTPQFRAKIAPNGGEPLLNIVQAEVSNKAAAQAVTDQMLLLLGTGTVASALDKVSGAGHDKALPAQYDFKVKKTSDGLRVEFDPKGKSFREIGEAINAECKRLGQPRAIAPNVISNSRMRLKPSGLVVVYPAVKESDGKTRVEQETRLRDRDMVRADFGAVAVAAGLYRLRYGSRPGMNGTHRDQGDLFNQRVVRTNLGALTTHDGTICEPYDINHDNDFPYGDGSHLKVLAAGSPIMNQSGLYYMNQARPQAKDHLGPQHGFVAELLESLFGK